MKTCVNCGTSLEDAIAFCTQCGTNQNPAPQERFCPNCGAKLVDGAAFCQACGVKPDGSRAGESPRQGGYAAPVRVSDWLVFSVITTVVFFPAGVGALIFSLLARASANSGDAPTAHSFAAVAKTWNVVVWLLALGGVVCAFLAILLFGGLAGVVAFFSAL